MKKRKPLTDEDGEVRELTAADVKHAMRFNQLPESIQGLLAKSASVPCSDGTPVDVVEAGPYMRNLIATDLRASRAESGLTQGELATKMKVSQTRVSRAEGGAEKVSLAFVKRWLIACGLPEDWKSK